LLHPIPIGALIVLIVNDHLLKSLWPGLVKTERVMSQAVARPDGGEGQATAGEPIRRRRVEPRKRWGRSRENFGNGPVVEGCLCVGIGGGPYTIFELRSPPPIWRMR